MEGGDYLRPRRHVIHKDRFLTATHSNGLSGKPGIWGLKRLEHYQQAQATLVCEVGCI